MCVCASVWCVCIKVPGATIVKVCLDLCYFSLSGHYLRIISLFCRVDDSRVVVNQLKRVQRRMMELTLAGSQRVPSLAQVRSRDIEGQ